MRIPFSMTALGSAAALSLAMVPPAYASDCMEELTSINKRISETQINYRVSMSADIAREVRELRNAARILQSHGQDRVLRRGRREHRIDYEEAA